MSDPAVPFDVPPEVRDPTESIRALVSTPFKEANMTLREHQEVDKHYIGDGLPVPSPSMVRPSGLANDSGESPFPARADHTHAQKIVYGVYTSAAMLVAPGTVYINNLTYQSGNNMLVSGQILDFPYNGLYQITATLNISRVGGGTFAGQMNVLFNYSGNTVARRVLRTSNAGLPNDLSVTVTDMLFTTTAPSVNDDFQISIQHNDSVSWNVNVVQLTVMRVGGTASN